MKFTTPLQAAILIKRYKRFLADVRIADGTEFTVHCPNSGSMRGCSTPDSQVFISRSGNPKRKYPCTLEMIREGTTWIGVNTMRTNHLVTEAIREGQISEFREMDSIKAEIKTSASSRLDLLLTKGKRTIYMEIKTCSLVEDGCAMFPDAVTTRGTKHLHELVDLVARGYEGVIFFCVQRMDADHFRPAAHIDPLYAEALAHAQQQGVKVLVYQAKVSAEEIRIVRALPFSLAKS
jgi:sugar fermentation stimulation protein A